MNHVKASDILPRIWIPDIVGNHPLSIIRMRQSMHPEGIYGLNVCSNRKMGVNNC